MKHRKVTVSKLNMPIYGFTYDVRVLTSLDDGRSWWYAGIGKYAKDEQDAAQKAEQLKEEYEAELIVYDE